MTLVSAFNSYGARFEMLVYFWQQDGESDDEKGKGVLHLVVVVDKRGEGG